ncbi:NUDIX domain-containing protein [Salisediminibacterium beveridgei]|uniref:DNA mismatch repair protein MutT n=1 Tax=Salisediminibacterium beveridgei TaxID=632773 RepID=A0A1D7QU60_9BACI|nr:NUDIX domain-containing protein [Salisediminibacterium beveridgei]AOM82529.1 DNA mismatch repair protein MutT [Salisediminibacterium beveridgei]
MSVLQAKIVVKAYAVYQGKGLVVHRTGKYAKWECPGGKVDVGEDLEAALVREVFEETGLSIVPGRLLYATLVSVENDLPYLVLTYSGTAASAQVELSDEHDAFEWVDERTFIQIMPKDIRKAFLEHGVFEQIKERA